MDEQNAEAQALPARTLVDTRQDVRPASANPRDQMTGEELTSDDLERTLAALRSVRV